MHVSVRIGSATHSKSTECCCNLAKNHTACGARQTLAQGSVVIPRVRTENDKVELGSEGGRTRSKRRSRFL